MDSAADEANDYYLFGLNEGDRSRPYKAPCHRRKQSNNHTLNDTGEQGDDGGNTELGDHTKGEQRRSRTGGQLARQITEG